MKMNEMSRSEEKNYKLVDLIKFICAFLVIGIHTRQFLSVSDIADRLFYYDVSNYSVPFFYACSGYFLLAKKSNIKLGDRLKIRIRKVLRLYLVWSLLYIPLTLYGWCIEGNWKLSYLFRCLRNFFVGENYYSWTLWYLNGLIFALLVIKLMLRKYSIGKMAEFGSVLYIIGVVLTILREHLKELPVIIACPIGMYFKLFLTTRNGLFQSLAFVSIGMQIAEAERFDKLRVSIQNAIVFVLVCAVKVFCSLFGGSDISKLLDLPTFYFMFAVIILECKENRLKGNFYKHLRSTSETMYFIHMCFVAFCALVLYKDDYNNFKSYLICAGGALAVSEIYSWMKNISNRSTTVSRLKHD